MKRFLIFQFIPSISIVLIFGFLVSCGGPTTQNSSQSTSRNEIVTWDWFSEQDIGIEFKYPAFLSISSETEKDRGPQGELIKTTVISASSKEPVIYLMFLIIEDPLRDVLYPEQYPPTRGLYQAKIASRLTNLESNKSDETDRDSILHTLDNINITKISGHHAALYQAELEKSFMGKTYIRGTEIITDNRDISIVIMGSIEPDVYYSVEPVIIDGLWKKLIDSLSIDYWIW